MIELLVFQIFVSIAILYNTVTGKFMIASSIILFVGLSIVTEDTIVNLAINSLIGLIYYCVVLFIRYFTLQSY